MGILLSVLGAIAVVAFNNCSKGFNADTSGILNSASAQCRAKVMTSAKSEELQKNPSLCEDASFYQCDVRRFRPGVGTEQSQGRQCLNIAGLGEACVNVVTYNFDTFNQQQDAEAQDLVEGGAYNRDEASCIHTQIKSRDIAFIHGEGSNLNSAFESALENCRQRSRP
ncbi:hypothetical protein [Bdellovibrio sp. HCB337]|uniref:hypothetical protein n=1 Tax=Bdellovibrio sp. HCB337 TaxID=3394358 RepID=UPI0039A6CD49